MTIVTREVVVGLGSNLGDRMALLRGALDAFRAADGVNVEGVSWVYETEPVGPPQPRYLNAALRLVTSLDLHQLLALALRIERDAGRERRERWGPRTLDIDILWAGNETLESEDLVVPHPHLEERVFALAPLLDVIEADSEPLSQRLSDLGGAPPRYPEILAPPK